MIVLDNGDKIRGDASVATVVDYTLHGLAGSELSQLADGQLADATGDLYTAEAIIVVSSVVLVNTHSASVTLNLFLLPSGGTARRVLSKDFTLGVGYSLHYDGVKVFVLSPTGAIVSSYVAHAASHTDGTDDIQNATAAQKGLATAAQITKLDAIEAEAKIGDVIASANLGDHKLVRGDGGAKGIQESTIVVSDDGEMVNTGQPCFNVNLSAEQTNIAKDEAVTIAFDTENFDVGNNFASSIFTAPVTGKYQLSLLIRGLDLDTAATYYYFQIKTSNRTYRIIQTPVFTADVGNFGWSLSVTADMDANDTAHCEIYQSGGTVQTDIHANTFFSGALIC